MAKSCASCASGCFGPQPVRTNAARSTAANAEADATVTFDQVLAVVDGENSKFGAPVVAGASVEAKVLKNGKSKKITVFKYRPKKDSKSIRGHRQPYTKVQIEKISV